jgi:hypothetical protein
MLTADAMLAKSNTERVLPMFTTPLFLLEYIETEDPKRDKLLRESELPKLAMPMTDTVARHNDLPSSDSKEPS